MSEAAATSRLSLAIERTPDGAMVRCRGRLIAGVGGVLYTEVRKLIPGSKRIVLDLTDLTQMDSMGLGTVVRLWVSAKSAGCELELINVGPRIRQILSVTNLVSVFNVVGEHNIRIV
jgi:anti-sigma B factor antagonist